MWHPYTFCSADSVSLQMLKLVFSLAKYAMFLRPLFRLELSVGYTNSARLSSLSELHFAKSTISTPYKISLSDIQTQPCSANSASLWTCGLVDYAAFTFAKSVMLQTTRHHCVKSIYGVLPSIYFDRCTIFFLSTWRIHIFQLLVITSRADYAPRSL